MNNKRKYNKHVVVPPLRQPLLNLLALMGNQKMMITYFFLLLTGAVGAQEDVCLKDVQRVYEAWGKEVNASKEQTIYLKYATEIVTGKVNDLEKNTSTIEVISNKDKSILLTTNMEVFQDRENTVSIMDDKKIVVINGYVGEEYKQQKLGQLELLKDTVFKELRTQECGVITKEGRNYKKVLLKMTPSGAKTFKIETITFLLDEKMSRVKEVAVKYIPGHRFYSMKMNIIKQDFNYQTTLTNASALTKILDSQGKLKSKYSGYQLIDNRN